MEKKYIKFWGVRGSHPTPDANKIDFGGDTSCVEIRFPNDLIILDMGSGIRNLGDYILQDNNTPKNIHIFLSHYHWDHIVGFLNFKPLFDSSFSFKIYGANKSTKINEVSKKLLDSSLWPVSFEMLNAKVEFIDIESDTIKIGDDININHTTHPHPNGATSYKISNNDFSIVYTTDCEHTNNILNKNVLDIAKNVDILIHDSHFTVEDLPKYVGWGHSSWKNAVDVATQSNVEKLILFHYNPEYSDEKVLKMELNAQIDFTNTIAAKQGLKINF